jgi:hypothetical protein
MTKWIRLEKKQGNPVEASGWRLTPLSWVFQIHFPWTNSSLVWNHPSAVIVEGPDQARRTIRIDDTTRIAQVAIFGGVLSTLFILAIIVQARR